MFFETCGKGFLFMFYKKVFVLVVILFGMPAYAGGGACDINSLVNGTSCVPCTGDTPFANSSQTECISCDQPDQYVDSMGQCKTCPAGNYILDGRTCEVCPAGYYCTNGIKTECGAFLVSSGGKCFCTRCPNNKYPNVGHTQCIECDISTGHYLENGECKLCGTGNYIENNNCIICPAGYYCDGSTKVLCDNGKISSRGASGCVSCPEAKPYANADRTKCMVCGKGYCINENECVLCPAGYSCPLNSSGSVHNCADVPKCPKGAYSAAGQDSCTLCGDGYTTESVGTVLDNNAALSDICKPIKIKLKFGNDDIELPSCLTPGKINSSVVKNN